MSSEKPKTGSNKLRQNVSRMSYAAVAKGTPAPTVGKSETVQATGPKVDVSANVNNNAVTISATGIEIPLVPTIEVPVSSSIHVEPTDVDELILALDKAASDTEEEEEDTRSVKSEKSDKSESSHTHKGKSDKPRKEKVTYEPLYRQEVLLASEFKKDPSKAGVAAAVQDYLHNSNKTLYERRKKNGEDDITELFEVDPSTIKKFPAISSDKGTDVLVKDLIVEVSTKPARMPAAPRARATFMDF